MAVPGIVLTISLLMINMVDLNKVQSDDSFDNSGTRARICFMFSLILGFGSIAAASSILAVSNLFIIQLCY